MSLPLPIIPPPRGFVKWLNFMYEGLEEEGYLVFTFDDQSITGHTKYEDYFPVVWNATRLHKGGMYQFSLTYYHDLAFTTAEIRREVIVPSAIGRIDIQQQVTLTGNTENGFEWSEPQLAQGLDSCTSAKNQTGDRQHICLSSLPKGKIPESLLYMHLKNNECLDVNFDIRLRVYVITDAAEIALLRKGSIICAPMKTNPVWDNLLHDPKVQTNWSIIYDYNAQTHKFIPLK